MYTKNTFEIMLNQFPSVKDLHHWIILANFLSEVALLMIFLGVVDINNLDIRWLV